MGYGYGVWLVHDQEFIRSEHLGHFTVACFMTREKAFNLYDAIYNGLGTEYVEIRLSGIPHAFDANFYEDDDNDISSWGYNGVTCVHGLWRKLEAISRPFPCNFSSYPHTSVEYSCVEDRTGPRTIPDIVMTCRLHVVDITSDDPIEWNVIT